MHDTNRLLVRTLIAAAQDAPKPTDTPHFPNSQHFPHSQRRLHRSALAVTVAAAVTLVVVVSIAVAASRLRTDPSPPSPTQLQAASKSTPTPKAENGPLVVLGQAVIPVPDGWTISDLACGDRPLSNSIFAVTPHTAFAACAAGGAPNVSDIELWSLDDPRLAGIRRKTPEHITLDDGRSALRGQEGGSSAGPSTTIVVVPDLNVVVFGTSPQPHVLDRYIAKVTRLPADYAVVPFLSLIGRNVDKVAARLSHLGLDVQIKNPISGPGPEKVAHLKVVGAKNLKLDAQPEIAIKKGSTVIVTVRSR